MCFRLVRTPCGNVDSCTSRPRCSGWFGSTVTSIQKRGRRCSRPCAARWTPTFARPTPMIAGAPPSVGPMPDLGEFDHLGPISQETARLLACDASVSRVILGPRSEPLDIGRRTPVVPAPMRRAVVVRDRTCRFPGCDRPPPWCDAHHVVHWADGGMTALANLVLLCRPHHRLVHHGFRVEMIDGKPLFRRPDGTILENRAPP